jgi:hypothetical protein
MNDREDRTVEEEVKTEVLGEVKKNVCRKK